MAKRNDTTRVDGLGFCPMEVRSDGVNVEDRTIEVIWAAGAPVKRYSWDEGYYMEELSMEASAIRLDRMNLGAPFLDTHDSYSMDSRLGAVVPGSTRIEGGKGYAKVKLSRSEKGERLLQDARDGLATMISVGYRVHKYEKTEGDGDKLPKLRATDWEPLEISAVPIPADPGAHARNAPTDAFTAEVVIINADADSERAAEQEETTMTPEEIAAAEAARTAEATRAAEATRVATEEASRRAAADEATRAAAQNSTTEAATRAAIEGERRRVQDLTDLAARGNVDAKVLQKAIADGVSLVAFRDQVLDAVIERQGKTAVFPHAETGGGRQDETETRREAVTIALLHRANPDGHKLTDAARQWRGLSLIETCREYLREQGENVRGMVPDEIARRSFMSTSDFPIILGNVTNRTLLAAYEALPQTWKPIARKATARDFKDKTLVRLGGAGALLKVNEHGEYKRSSLIEGKEKYRIATYGRVVAVTRQVLINDDLGAFTDLPNTFGQQVANLESDLVWGAFLSGLLSDGNGIFHASHGNIATAAAFSADSIATTRLKMVAQTDMDGKTKLNLRPAFMLLPAALEYKAEQLMGSFTPAVAGNVTPESMRKLTPIVEPRLDDVSATAFYLAASPAQLAGLEYAYLEGNEGPYTETRQGFDVDGVEFKVRLDFGAAPIDYRPFAKNAGA